MSEYTDDQIKIVKTLVDSKIKVRIANSMIIAFFVILAYMFYVDGWQNKVIAATLDAILSRTIYPMVKYYFGEIKTTLLPSTDKELPTNK